MGPVALRGAGEQGAQRAVRRGPVDEEFMAAEVAPLLRSGAG